MRAYREARDVQQRSRLGAVLLMPALGVRYALEGVRDVFVDAFGQAFGNIGGLARGFGFVSLVKALFSICCLPLLLVVALCQLVLRVLYVIFSTLLHLFCVAVLVVALVVRLVFKFTMGWFMFLFEKSFNLSRDTYGVLLSASLRFSAVFLLLVAAIAVHSGFIATKLGRELIPPMKQGEFGMRMEARAGTRLVDTERRAHKFEKIIREHPEVDTVTVEIGQERKTGTTKGGENVAQFTVQLKDPERTAPIQDGIIREMRDKVLRERTDENINFTLPSMFSFKTAIELMVVGEDLGELRRVGSEAVELIRKVAGVKDAELSIKTGYPELIIELDRESLAEKRISPGQVALRLRTEVQGDVATRFSRGGEKVDIRVRTDQALLSSVDDLRKLSVVDGPVPIPLSDVAKITVQEGPSEIRRVDQKQVAVITTNVEGRDLAAVAGDIDEAVKAVNKPDDFYFQQGGQNRELNTAYSSLRFALILAIFLVYVVMACQFESIIHPALVMFSIPLAFIGVIYTLYYTETSLSVMVFLGGIILAGIVVKNAIVLVDYINLLRERGMPKAEAIVLAGKVRLRPIIMTTLTTVLGLLPMLVATGEGSEMRKPMALTVIAGLSLSTLLTLVVIPMVYYLFGGKDKTR
jgi:HAE1 family hydrophobic/amphiphilic exporter-1